MQPWLFGGKRIWLPADVFRRPKGQLVVQGLEAWPVIPIEDAVRGELEVMAWRDRLKINS